MHSRVVLVSLANALLFGSCADGHSAPDDGPATSVEQSIVRGEPAVGPAYAAVGALVASRTIFDQNIGALRTIVTPFCTASLISRTVLLTAKHCVRTLEGALEDPLIDVIFALGPDALNPVRKVSIAGAAAAPGDQGGFVHFGRDVGVVFLGEQVTEVEPLKLATLRDRMVGADLEAVGFGIRDEALNFGTRQKGIVRLSALQGRVFEHALGDFEGFQRWLTEDLFVLQSGPDHVGDDAPLLDAGFDAGVDAGAFDTAPPETPNSLHVRYDDTLLVPDYEAFVGGDADSAQPCSGDSGGPLLKDGKVYGVASGVLRTNKLVCDYGAVYATFGPDVMAFLKEARRDPCKGVAGTGECSGRAIVRCVSQGGERRLDKQRCQKGALCAVKNGAAQCVTSDEASAVAAEASEE